MTFEKLNFNTRIHYELRPPCFSLNRLREIVDDYCSCDNETALVPIRPKSRLLLYTTHSPSDVFH